MNYWVVKQEPEAYSWMQFVADGKTDWTGVRNFQARNNLKAMAVGDAVLYYHSGEEKAVVGIATVSREAFADPTAGEGNWIAVELQAKKPLGKPVTLATIKADAVLKEIALARQSRLSVSPLTREAYQHIVSLGKA